MKNLELYVMMIGDKFVHTEGTAGSTWLVHDLREATIWNENTKKYMADDFDVVTAKLGKFDVRELIAR